MLPNLLGGKLLTGVLPPDKYDHVEPWLPSHSPIVDIESCIDDPSLAPLGGHIRLVNNKQKQRKKEYKSQVKIRRKHDLLHKDIHGAGLLMLRRKNLTTDDLAQQLKATQAPFLMQQHLKTTHWFDGLVELDISRNKLSSLPSEISNLTHLRTLNASSNLLTHLPIELYHLTGLEVLLLSQNQLYTIPDELPLQLPYLVTLSVAGNRIDYLTPNISRWKHMCHLQLGSVYGGNLLTRIPDTIVDMPCLEELDLSCNQLCVLPGNMYIPSLVHLNVSRNQLDSLPTSIGRCHGLKTLNVSKNHLTTLPANLVELEKLELLDISENLLCIMPADILERMNTTLLITGNPLTRPGHCDSSSPSDAYAQLLKRMTMRALPMMTSSSTSSSSSSNGSQHLLGHQCGPQGNGCLSIRSPQQSRSLSPSIPMPPPPMIPMNNATYLATPTPTPTSSSPMPTLLHEEQGDDTDDDAMIDRELSFLAQQLNVQGARRDRQMTPPSPPSPLSINDPASDDMVIPRGINNGSSSPGTDDMFSRSLLMEAVDMEEEEEEGASCTMVEPSLCPSDPSPSTNMLHSLRELATRVILQYKLKVPLHMIPPHLANDLSKHRRCAKCQQPFVNEWLTSVQVKSYGGHPAVVRRVRFCSTRCWQHYLHSRKKSVVCVHQSDTQPILRQSAEQEENDWLSLAGP